MSSTPESPEQPEPYAEPRSGGRMIWHLLSLLTGLVLTPIAIALMTYGGARWLRAAQNMTGERDLPGLAALLAGAFLLVLVASLGARSAVGPLLAGVVWGVFPALVYVAGPLDATGWVLDVPGLPAEIENGTVTWLAVGCFLAVGATLLGAGFSGALRRS